MSTQYGYWQDFCRDSGSATSTIPVCNLFPESITNTSSGFAGGCTLTGIPLSNGRHLTNLGSIVLDGIAILVTLFLLWRTERKRAAVGRREMQVFLIGYIIISICEIFTIGGFPLRGDVRKGFSAVHIAAVTTTSWILLLNGLIGYQILDDGTPLSVGLVTLSSVCFFVGTGYIALDTGFDWTGFFNKPENRQHGSQLPAVHPIPACSVGLYQYLLPLGVVPRLASIRGAAANAVPPRSGVALRDQPNLPIRHQRAPLHSQQRRYQWRPLRNALHAARRLHAMDVLVQYNGG